MNTYSLGIAGSWWLLALLLLLSYSGAVWYYSRTLPPLPPLRRFVHILLRGTALALLLTVLFEPVLSLIRSTEEDARVAVLLDNSQSAAMTDAKGSRKEVYRKALQLLNLPSVGKQADVASFDESVVPFADFVADSLHFSGQRTDIDRAFRFAAERSDKQNTQAVLLVTDGAFNTGSNPLYEAEILGKPVYIVGIGDSLEPKDASVQSLITNEIAYLGSVLPVSINLKISGYNEGQLKVSLSDNGSVVGEQTVTINPQQQNYSLVFEYKPTQAGNRKLTAHISELGGELTAKNNAVSEFVNVLSDKRKIVLFAGAPSPDVAFIRSVYEADKSVQVKSYIQKQGADFYDEAPSAAALRDAEVIVFIGFPIQSTPQSALQLVQQELQRGKPLLFIASQQTDYNKLRMLDDYMPFTVQTSRPNEFAVLADVEEGKASNPLIRLRGTAEDVKVWNQLPPLFRTETFVKVKPEAEVVASMKVNNVALNEPLIVTRSFQRSKTVAVMGYGLYRWRLLGNAAEQAKGKSDLPDVLSSFLSNSAKWLTTSDDQKTVRIKATKRFYSSGERVEFVGQVYDAAYTPIDNATLTVKISGGKSEQREIVLSNAGNGRYTASVEGLAEGDYAFNGTVVVNNKPYGSDAGRFSVGELALEYQNLRMNVELLRSIAERTGGKFYTPEQAEQCLKDIKQHKSFQARTITGSNEFALWNLAYLLAGAILCFALEWFLRKRAGMV